MPATYVPIATITASSGSSMTFSSIPSTYDDLILIGSYACSSNSNLGMSFNSDTGNNYYEYTWYWENAGFASAGQTETRSDARIGYFVSSNTERNQTIVHINGYKQTTFAKPVLTKKGPDGSYQMLRSDLWLNTNAITSITLTWSSGTFTNNSKFTLFGIKGA